jgi:hypothetical protein
LNVCGTSRTPSLLLHQLQLENCRNHKREPWWAWTRRWRQHPNEILLWLVEYRSSNKKKKLPVRT